MGVDQGKWKGGFAGRGGRGGHGHGDRKSWDGTRKTRSGRSVALAQTAKRRAAMQRKAKSEPSGDIFVI